MDYEFFQTLGQKPRVQMSMGHEAIGHWLNEEVSALPELLAQLDPVVQIIGTSAKTWHQPGREYSIWINAQAVKVLANSLGFETETLEEGMTYYDSEQRAECGLEDFLTLLYAYQTFCDGHLT